MRLHTLATMLAAVAAKPVNNALQPDTHEQAGERKAELFGSFFHSHTPTSTDGMHRHAPTSTDGMHRHHPTAGKKAAALQGKPQHKAELWGSGGFFGHTHSPVPNLHRHAPTSTDGMHRHHPTSGKKAAELQGGPTPAH